jgi:drug/metabolite transporter (DMT)-like permease
MEMFAGGVLLLVVAAGTGELRRFDPSAVSARSMWALAYLIVFGAIVAFSAYVWLLQKTTPARAATYAYVNPVVAVVLGWALASEPLSPRILLAGAMIVAAVVLIVGRPARRRAAPAASAGAPSTAPAAAGGPAASAPATTSAPALQDAS